MAMGIVSDSLFEKEIGSLNPTPKSPTITDSPTPPLPPDRGRKEGDVEVPNALREIIGQTSITHGRAEAIKLARNFGISESSVSAYAVGATSTSSYENRPNFTGIINTRERIQKKSLRKLMLALNELTEEKIRESSARDITGIAKDLSIVSKNMEARTEDLTKSEDNKTPTFVFYSPQFFKEDKFTRVISTDSESK